MTMRYSLRSLPGAVFIRRPVSEPPPEGTICFVDDGTASGWSRGQACGVFKGGVWTNGKGRALKFEPTYWTTMEPEARCET